MMLCKVRWAMVLVGLVLMAGNPVQADVTAGAGYTATPLYTYGGTDMGGLDYDGGYLYFGEAQKIRKLEVSSTTVSDVSALGSNMGISLVTRVGGTTYTSYGTSNDPPYPYKMGYIDGSGNYQNQLDMDGIYDMANNGATNFIVANPSSGGSKIYKYDAGTTTEIANIGGYSGGLAFDSAGNLYYADQGVFGVRDASVLKFTAAEVAAGGLTAADGDAVLNITAGFIGLDADDNFFATTGWGATFSEYDLATQSKLHDIASGSIGKFVWDGETVYMLSTSWGNGDSKLYSVTPEPATMTLLGVTGLALLRRGRHRN